MTSSTPMLAWWIEAGRWEIIALYDLDRVSDDAAAE
jgi:hypothetical protein